jgi:hypothetical protein
VCWSATADTRLEATTAFYEGSLSVEHNVSFFDMVDGQPVRRLIITSSGGEVEAGIELGEWVYRHGIDVEVPDHCLSSCANYVFPAGRNKTILDGAMVAWHGNYHHLKATGLWLNDVSARMKHTGETLEQATQQVRQQMEHLVRLEHDFFAAIAVDQHLCWIGKMPPYNAPNYYYLSPQDMARFGLTQVRASVDYQASDLSRFSDLILFIRLE